MRKAIIASLSLFSLFLIIAGASIFVYANAFESVTEWTGKYFDESGRQLGICKIESKLRMGADAPESTTLYYTANLEYVGQCQGAARMGAGCLRNLQKQPTICSSANLQTQCDESMYPDGAKPKYLCITE
jgi:hypothetical protein